MGSKMVRLAGRPSWDILPPDSPVRELASTFAHIQRLRPAAMSSVQALTSCMTSMQSPRGLACDMAQAAVVYLSPATIDVTVNAPLRTAMQSPGPQYYMAPSGHPVNRSNGVVITEPRTIIVHGLPDDMKKREVERLLQRAGELDSCEIMTRAGKSAGKATAKYKTGQAAIEAQNMFHMSRFQGRTLQARLATDADKVTSAVCSARTPQAWKLQTAEPLIANGSLSRR